MGSGSSRDNTNLILYCKMASINIEIYILGAEMCKTRRVTILLLSSIND